MRNNIAAKEKKTGKFQYHIQPQVFWIGIINCESSDLGILTRQRVHTLAPADVYRFRLSVDDTDVHQNEDESRHRRRHFHNAPASLNVPYRM